MHDSQPYPQGKETNVSNSSVHRHVNRFWLIGLAALCVGTSLPYSVAAQAYERGSSIKVRYGDLNLASETDVAELYRRIDRAARKVCHWDISPLETKQMQQRQSCIKTAVANAVSDVNNQKLTAMFRQKSGQPLG